MGLILTKFVFKYFTTYFVEHLESVAYVKTIYFYTLIYLIKMTTLKEKIEAEMKTAMRAKETVKLTALRAIKSAILLAQTEKGSTSETLSEQQELDILLKQAKQRRESLVLYEQEGRTELAETEKAELEVIEKFLPQMLSEDEVRVRVEKILAGMGKVTPQQMGQVMGAAIKELGTEAEKQTIAKVVKELINKNY